MKTYTYTIKLEPAEEGGYIVTVPALPGCVTQGETKEEALTMARDAIHVYLESLISDGEPIPVEQLPTNRVTVSVFAPDHATRWAGSPR